MRLKDIMLVMVLVFAAGPVCGYVPDNLEFIDLAAGGKITNSLGMEFVWIPPGSFLMGSPKDEPKRDDDERQHEVRLTRGFYLGVTEVTVGQWRQFMREGGYRTEAEKEGWAWAWNGDSWKKKRGANWDNPGFPQSGDHPVSCVSFNDAQAFIKWLNGKEGLHKYRLPTEAEWEYACRAGTKTPFNTGACLSSDQANYDGNYPLPGCAKGIYLEKTVPVKSFAPNAWGLYDMHGNVWEWCADWYDKIYPSSLVTDPSGPSSGSVRVSRGGSWCNDARSCRSANRSRSDPTKRIVNVGLRLARTK